MNSDSHFRFSPSAPSRSHSKSRRRRTRHRSHTAGTAPAHGQNSQTVTKQRLPITPTRQDSPRGARDQARLTYHASRFTSQGSPVSSRTIGLKGHGKCCNRSSVGLREKQTTRESECWSEAQPHSRFTVSSRRFLELTWNFEPGTVSRQPPVRRSPDLATNRPEAHA